MASSDAAWHSGLQRDWAAGVSGCNGVGRLTVLAATALGGVHGGPAYLGFSLLFCNRRRGIAGDARVMTLVAHTQKNDFETAKVIKTYDRRQGQCMNKYEKYEKV